ncbi:fasciclin domain-containing protein [Mucilaginibacter antarcticus]|uniref:Fasciclin domain-containing protein n=1 Tax=Mucilaginibacter antarcticus TaxID=1855725 RepID=A0ABW5XUM1_9SPHI
MRKIFFLVISLAFNTVLFAQTNNRSDSSAQPQTVKQLTLTKAEGALMLSTNDVVTNISRSPELSEFYKAIQNAGLEETFTSQGPITVFAPGNQAFNLLSKGKRDTLRRADQKYKLIALLTYHALPGAVTTKDIAHAIAENKGVAIFITLSGNKISARLDANRNIVLIDDNGGQSIINKFDVPQSNGLIHFINAVLVPKFKTI